MLASGGLLPPLPRPKFSSTAFANLTCVNQHDSTLARHIFAMAFKIHSIISITFTFIVLSYETVTTNTIRRQIWKTFFSSQLCWLHLYVFPIQCASIWPCPCPTKPLVYQLIFATAQKLGRCRSPTRPTGHRKLTFRARPLPRFSSPRPLLSIRPWITKSLRAWDFLL